jgi:hypothetical protein
VYVRVAPLVEHPRKTIESIHRDGTTVLRARSPYGVFEVENKNLYVDIPILLALALMSPGVGFRARLRIVGIGCVVLGFVHLVAFACTVHLAYVQIDLERREIYPGFFALNVIAPLRRLFYSDFDLLFPFLVWGLLYAREQHRLLGKRHPSRDLE